jgi:hypothetical protein
LIIKVPQPIVYTIVHTQPQSPLTQRPVTSLNPCSNATPTLMTKSDQQIPRRLNMRSKASRGAFVQGGLDGNSVLALCRWIVPPPSQRRRSNRRTSALTKANKQPVQFRESSERGQKETTFDNKLAPPMTNSSDRVWPKFRVPMSLLTRRRRRALPCSSKPGQESEF